MEFGEPTLQGTNAGTSPTCDHCDNPPVVFCVDCKIYFCSLLVEAHKQGKKTSRHQLRDCRPSSQISQVIPIFLCFFVPFELKCKWQS